MRRAGAVPPFLAAVALLLEAVSLAAAAELQRRLLSATGVRARWTTLLALLISLRRADIVLPGDLALRKAVRRAYALDHLPSQQEVLDLADKWRPYRSLATTYLSAAAYEPAGP